jgi:hypothetical protein
MVLRRVLSIATLLFTAGIPAALADGPSYPFATPVFGLDTAPDGSLLVADAGAGIVRLRAGGGHLIAALPTVSDVAPTPSGMLAVTGGTENPAQEHPLRRKLFRIAGGKATEIADLAAYERAVNPDGGVVDSNPFDVAVLADGSALVADAAANALLRVTRGGKVDWVATLPTELVSTAHLKGLVGCPAGPPNFCNLPPQLPAEAVATSVAVGPDGAFYVGELKGFPAPIGESRVWRIRQGARHARCGASPDCRVVADGFTNVIDLRFGPDGKLYVVELDEAGWFALESGRPAGGSVSSCRARTGHRAWSCETEATGLLMPMAATIDARGRVRVVVNALIPGAAAVVTLP